MILALVSQIPSKQRKGKLMGRTCLSKLKLVLISRPVDSHNVESTFMVFK